MKTCLTCGSTFDAQDWICRACGAEPQCIDGFLAFAPDLQSSAPNYRPEFHEGLARIEAGHYWFQSRNELITWAFGKCFPQARDFLEVGCGTGFVLSGLRMRFPDLQVSGSEIYTSGLKYAAQRVPSAALFQMDARAIPFKSAFDVIGAFDVIEHISEDAGVISQMRQALRPEGGLILTVPQHPFLWSRVDEYAGHVRRYRRKDLIRLLEAQGFEVLLACSFVSLLFPIMAASRMLDWRPSSSEMRPELSVSPRMNGFLSAIQRAEIWMVRKGIRFPVGGSLLLVARRREGIA